jgi:hypothetical protein
MRYVMVLLLFLCTALCYASDKIIKLPEDGTKWHVSVLGDANDEQYQALVKQFQDGKLATLRQQVHFHPVTTDNPMYEHYKPTVKSLPLVRVQDATGYTIYEASKDKIPSNLYNSIAHAAEKYRLLPWRRHQEQKQSKGDKQSDDEEKSTGDDDDDPSPDPVNDGAAPDVPPEPEVPDVGVLACILVLVAGVGLGLHSARVAYHNKKS